MLGLRTINKGRYGVFKTKPDVSRKTTKFVHIKCRSKYLRHPFILRDF